MMPRNLFPGAPTEGATKPASSPFTLTVYTKVPTHSVGSAQVKEDRQDRLTALSAHFPPPVLLQISGTKENE